MEYNVVVHYEGAINFKIKAENKDKAKQIAEMEFASISAETLAEHLADCNVCDCWKVEG